MRLLCYFLTVLTCIASVAHGRIFKDEEVLNPAGYPALVHFQAGSRGKPLVVLIAGSGNTGRIFYGPHSGADPDQFLATHLNALGYNVLSVTTPISTGEPIFALNYPTFSIRDWGKLLAEVAAIHVERYDLQTEVLLVGWSMAGKAAQSMSAQAKDAGVSVSLFVSLSATPPVLGVLPSVTDFPMNPETGYGLSPDPAFKGYLWNIRINARQEGLNAIVPEDELLSHYVGEGPVGLSFTGIRYRDGRIVADQLGDIHDAQGHRFAEFPLVATIVPHGRHDLRHTVTDLYTWGMITTNSLYHNHIANHRETISSAKNSEIERLSDLITSAPSRLTKKVQGNHFFFVGETGARKTAEAISWLDAEAQKLLEELKRALPDDG